MAVTPDLAESILLAISQGAGRVFTAFPARVVSYNAAAQTADLQPVIREPLFNDDDEVSYSEMPILPNQPIVFPRGGGCSITWPINVGDHVLCIVSMFNTGTWRSTGETSDPIDLRRHHINSVFAIAGVAPDASPLASGTDPGLVVDANSIKLGNSSASDFAALASVVNANFQNIVNLFSGWTVVPNDGGGALKTASASLSFAPVECTRVRVL